MEIIPVDKTELQVIHEELSKAKIKEKDSYP